MNIFFVYLVGGVVIGGVLGLVGGRTTKGRRLEQVNGVRGNQSTLS
jgi:hypothetical protein